MPDIVIVSRPVVVRAEVVEEVASIDGSGPITVISVIHEVAEVAVTEPKAVLVEVGLQGPAGPRGERGPAGEGDLPDGVNDGDIIRWNAISGAWESCAEPFEFQGIVLVPMALPGAPVDGQVGFNIADNALYVAIP